MSATRDALIAVTTEMIQERGGAAGVSLREVARRTGCAPTNVYNHFADFAALLNAANLRIIAVSDAAERAGGQMAELVRMAAAGQLTDAETLYVTRAVYAYLLGELSAVVTGRERPADEAAYVEALTRTCVAVFRSLVRTLPDTTEVLT